MGGCLVRYRPGDSHPVDLGTVAVPNPDFTDFKDKTVRRFRFTRVL